MCCFASARTRLVYIADLGEDWPQDVNSKGPFCIFPYLVLCSIIGIFHAVSWTYLWVSCTISKLRPLPISDLLRILIFSLTLGNVLMICLVWEYRHPGSPSQECVWEKTDSNSAYLTWSPSLSDWTSFLPNNTSVDLTTADLSFSCSVTVGHDVKCAISLENSFRVFKGCWGEIDKEEEVVWV